MPVSTRSQILNHEENEVATEQRTRKRSNHEKTQLGLSHRNPHHGLKEKMKALTLLYEQQKRASSALRNPNQSPRPEENRFTTHPSVQLLSSCKKEGKRDEKPVKEQNDSDLDWNVMRENVQIPPAPIYRVTRKSVLPQVLSEGTKENIDVGVGKTVRFSSNSRKQSPSKNVARKLSMVTSLQQVADRNEMNGERHAQEAENAQKAVNVTCDSRILVFVRLRPMAKKEKEVGSRSCVKIVNRREVFLTEFANENDYLRLKRLRGRHFVFDASFPETTSQQEVYSASTAELVEAVLQGRNGSVFCYGATGAGKTYTMLGTMENPGVMVLAIKDLFTKIRQRSCDGNHLVHLSYLEVYNESVRDLLSPGRPLILREDKQGIMAAGLTQYRAYSTDEVMALLQRGNQNRTTEPTRCNETSSRSHAILQVIVEYRIKDSAMNVINRAGKLSLIDLAGSERALATDQRTLRSLEGANINRSLLALSSCINALVEGKKHIPYRNSKLTQLLKDSLGGSCNTVMIANISPSNISFGETQNTLHWADRAKEIRIKASEANEELVQVLESGPEEGKLLLELQKENRELRVQLARQQQKFITLQAQTLASNSNNVLPTPPSVTSLLMTPPSTARPAEKRNLRSSSFLTTTCFTPESKRKCGEEAVKVLRLTVKELKMEMERMKKEHSVQLKKKDELILELTRTEEKKIQTARRTSMRCKQNNIGVVGELKSPMHRFKSPVATAKKRSFWDITTGNSPSMVNGRKTRSHVVPESSAAPPSMLPQPGFARPRSNQLKN